MTAAPRRSAMADLFFVSPAEWDDLVANGEFSHVVVGSGICALAFVKRLIEFDPRARILMVERGGFLLPENLQGLDPVFSSFLGPASELYPWRSCTDSEEDLFIRGILPYLGGKSITWSGWCPRPTETEISTWPAEVVATLDYRFAEAEAFLGVVAVDRLGDHLGRYEERTEANPYRNLQRGIQDLSARGVPAIRGLRLAEPARLALMELGRGNHGFKKFSVPVPLLRLMNRAESEPAGSGHRLRIVTDCHVQRIVQHAGSAVALQTTLGRLPLRGANLVLAAGTVPSTALVMATFPEARNAGTRLTAHSVTLVQARIPIEDFEFAGMLEDTELAAVYVSGETAHSQFHLQITAVRCAAPEAMYTILRRYAPDCDAFVAPCQLSGSERFIVLSCAALGEFGRSSRRCYVAMQEEEVRVHLSSTTQDRETWDAMDAALFELIESALSPAGLTHVQYWMDDPSGGRWSDHRPGLAHRRQAGLVHEGSTLWIGADSDSVVDLDYRVRGTANVYATGGALWPTAGSWNPTLTMVVLAQDLAVRLSRETID